MDVLRDVPSGPASGKLSAPEEGLKRGGEGGLERFIQVRKSSANRSFHKANETAGTKYFFPKKNLKIA